MTGYMAIFVNVDGLDETDVEPSYYLSALDTPSATDEALALPVPEGANMIKLAHEGLVVERLFLPFSD